MYCCFFNSYMNIFFPQQGNTERDSTSEGYILGGGRHCNDSGFEAVSALHVHYSESPGVNQTSVERRKESRKRQLETVMI